jgi:ABC-2 type transport system ATP-binding protein
MVACGTVDELRSSGEARLVVESPTTDWAATLSGVRVIESNGTRCVLELADGVDDQAVLHAALAAGPVHEFSRQRPSLTELFRNVVTIEGRSA